MKRLFLILICLCFVVGCSKQDDRDVSFVASSKEARLIDKYNISGLKLFNSVGELNGKTPFDITLVDKINENHFEYLVYSNNIVEECFYFKNHGDIIFRQAKKSSVNSFIVGDVEVYNISGYELKDFTFILNKKSGENNVFVFESDRLGIKVAIWEKFGCSYSLCCDKNVSTRDLFSYISFV